MNFTIYLRIILQQPISGVLYGLQKGRGSVYEVLQKQLSEGSDLAFTLQAEVRANKSGQPDFYGDFVQGKSGERFIYLNIGQSAGQFTSPWSRRLKVPLRDFSDGISENNYVATVAATAKDGTPTCATVKPFGGWEIAE